MTPVVETLLQQLGHQRTADRAVAAIAAMTGCQFVLADEAVKMVFKRQVGKKKVTHLKITYNAGTDLYDLKGYKYNRKTCACPEVMNLDGIYAEDMKRICEETTGLYFTL